MRKRILAASNKSLQLKLQLQHADAMARILASLLNTASSTPMRVSDTIEAANLAATHRLEVRKMREKIRDFQATYRKLHDSHDKKAIAVVPSLKNLTARHSSVRNLSHQPKESSSSYPESRVSDASYSG